MFDVREHLDGLRCRETGWLLARRDAIVRERRRLHVEELAITAVLDERGQIDETFGQRDGISARNAQITLETARRLESLPTITAAAADGRLSDEQLRFLAQLADETTDEEWAERAPSVSPAVLARKARCKVAPTTEESRDLREVRSWTMWRGRNQRILWVKAAFVDVDAEIVEDGVNTLADKLRPPKGQPWDTREHRAADSIVMLFEHARDKGENAPPLAARPLFVAELPIEGPATIAGIPVADAVLEQWRANADIEPHFVDADGRIVVIGRKTSLLTPKLARAIWLRDQHCTCGNCDRRYGLQIHHLRPRSWGGTDDPANMALVCSRGPDAHHPLLVPHGPWALVGNPFVVGGLRMVHADDLTDDEADQIGLPDELRRRRRSRAGPDAA